MCGRFNLHASLQDLADAFRFSSGEVEIRPRYNIAPSQNILAVRSVAGETNATSREQSLRDKSSRDKSPRIAMLLRWGLIPSWSKDASASVKMINARSETVAIKPAFRSAFKRKRCIVPANGYYEWKREVDLTGPDVDGDTTRAARGGKTPWHFSMADRAPFAMAGLWESWTSSEGATIETCCLLTCGPNELMRSVHDRMPVILDSDGIDSWLSPDASVARLAGLLLPFPSEKMTGHEVSRVVNSPRNDSEECIKPSVEWNQAKCLTG